MAYLAAGKILVKCRNQVWGSRKQIKFTTKKQDHACQEIQLWVTTVYL